MTTASELKAHNARVRQWVELFPHRLRKVAMALGYPADVHTWRHSYSVEWMARNSRRYHRGRDQVSRATIFRQLPDIEATGMVEVRRRVVDGNKRETSEYIFDFSAESQSRVSNAPAEAARAESHETTSDQAFETATSPPYREDTTPDIDWDELNSRWSSGPKPDDSLRQLIAENED